MSQDLRGEFMKYPVSRFLKSILSAIAINIAVPCNLYADQVDDFKKECEKIIADYWTSVRSLAHAEKNEIAPSHVRENLGNIAFYTSLDALGLFSASESVTSDIGRDIDAANEMATEFNNLVSIKPFNLENHRKLIDLSLKLQVLGENLPTKGSELQAIYDSIQIGMKPFEGFCDREASLLEFKKTPLAPKTLQAKPNYTYIRPDEFYRDPVAYAYAEIAGLATLAAGIGIYLYLYGFDALIKALAFEATTNGAAVGFKGSAAYIPALAIVVAMAVGNYIERLENEARKKEARNAYNKLVTQIEEARAWFEKNRLQDSEFRTLALEECKRNELALNPKTNKPGILFDLKLQLEIQSQKLKADTATQNQLIARVRENVGKLNSLLKDYETELELTVGTAVFADHKTKTISMARVGLGWDIYNRQVKPLWDKFQSFYAENRTDCIRLYDFFDQEVKTPADLSLDVVIEALKDDGNRNNPDFSLMNQMKNELVSGAESKVNRCIAKLGA